MSGVEWQAGRGATIPGVKATYSRPPLHHVVQGPPRLILVSADGMGPAFYRRPDDPGTPGLPNLRRLVREGASADAVESIYPTTTYPAHASLVTGVPPRVHGIYSHLASLDPTEQARPWHWFARAIRVPTLWDAAQACGRTVAAISWPVSAGARIAFNIPEIWDPAAPDPHADFATAARYSTPGLFAELVKLLQPRLVSASPDELRAEAALYLWKRHRPDILLVHFVGYDHASHIHGPASPQALAALEKIDQLVGRLREGVAAEEAVTWIVLSDHGFLPVEKEVAPLVVFSEEGLFGRDADNRPALAKLGAVHAGGSFAVYWLDEPARNDCQALSRAIERLQRTGGVSEIVDRAKLEELEADPDAELMLEAAPGFHFSDRFDGPVVQESPKDRGTHGQLPSCPGLEASFIATGRGIRPGKSLGRISLTQIAPTLVRHLGLPQDVLASKADPLDLA